MLRSIKRCLPSIEKGEKTTKIILVKQNKRFTFALNNEKINILNLHK